MSSLYTESPVTFQPNYAYLGVLPDVVGPVTSVLTTSLTAKTIIGVNTINGAAYPPTVTGNFQDSTTFIVHTADPTVSIGFSAAGTTSTSATMVFQQSANRQYIFPDSPVDTQVLLAAAVQTLTNKSFVGATTYILNATDPTKQLIFDVEGTTGTTATIQTAQTTSLTYTIPNTSANDTFMLLAATQQASNKSFAANSTFIVNATTPTIRIGFSATGTANTLATIATAAIANRTYTIPDSGASTSFVMVAGTQTLAGKSFVDTSTAIVNATDATKQILFSAAGNASSTTATIATATVTPKTYTIPDSGASTSFVMAVGAQTLYSKTLDDTSTIIANTADPTKQIIFSAAGNTTGIVATIATQVNSNTTYTIPNTGASTQFVMEQGVQTITNKIFTDSSTRIANVTNSTKKLAFTLGSSTANTIATIATANTTSLTYTIPDSPTNDSFVLASAPQQFANKSFVDASTYIVNVTDATKQINFSVGGNTTATTATIATATTTSRTYTIPDSGASTSFIMAVGAQTLYSKTIDDTSTIIANTADTTKQLLFNLSAAATGSVTTISMATSGAATYTIPNTGGSTQFVMEIGTQTLYNKSLVDSSTIIQNAILSSRKLKFLLTGMTAGNIATIAPINTTTITYTIPDSPTNDTFVLVSAPQTVFSKALDDTTTTIANTTDPTKQIAFTAASNTTGVIATIASAAIAARTYTIPDSGASTSFVMAAGTQSLAGKSLVDASTFIVNVTDATKRIEFSAAGNTTAITATIATAAIAARTYTIPDAGASTSFIMGASSQTIAGTITMTGLITDTITQFTAGHGVYVNLVNVNTTAIVLPSPNVNFTLSSIAATSTNTSIGLIPTGTGSIMCTIPDNTAVGGQTRGVNSVDMQLTRLVNNQVASGANSTISGGYANAATTQYSTIGGGTSNLISTGTASTIGGGTSNQITGTNGTVGGGSMNNVIGSGATIGGGNSNTATGLRSTVAGGTNNSAGSQGTTVGGGDTNSCTGGNNSTIAGGVNNTVTSDTCTIGGGSGNATSASTATVSGGVSNGAGGQYATVGGGTTNIANGTSATIGGGNGNTAATTAATVGGGASNSITVAINSTIGGGSGNSIVTQGSTIGGGTSNAITVSTDATIAGGNTNKAQNTYAVIGGGFTNKASGVSSTVSGGDHNTASASTTTVGGGSTNTSSGQYATISGGFTNMATAASATVGGGDNNTAGAATTTVSGGSTNSANTQYCTVGGGFTNAATGIGACIAGGTNNTASVTYATISGGYNNTASVSYSTIAGGNGNQVITAGPAGTICGGGSNTVGAKYASILGGTSNVADGNFATVGGGTTNLAHGAQSGIFGGSTNTIDSASNDAFIGGGLSNSITGAQYAGILSGTGHTVGSIYSTICGGNTNSIDSASGDAFIGGGASLAITNGNYSGVLSGQSNTVNSTASVICGGYINKLTAAATSYGFIGGGTGNQITAGSFTTIAGGNGNTISANYAAIGGGNGNAINGGSAGVIGGGTTNTVAGTNAGILAGSTNMATGASAGILAGDSCTASGTDSAVLWGLNSQATNTRSVAGGNAAVSSGAGALTFTDNTGTTVTNANTNRAIMSFNNGYRFVAAAAPMRLNNVKYDYPYLTGSAPTTSSTITLGTITLQKQSLYVIDCRFMGGYSPLGGEYSFLVRSLLVYSSGGAATIVQTYNLNEQNSTTNAGSTLTVINSSSTILTFGVSLGSSRTGTITYTGVVTTFINDTNTPDPL